MFKSISLVLSRKAIVMSLYSSLERQRERERERERENQLDECRGSDKFRHRKQFTYMRAKRNNVFKI